jgi:flagellar biosynthesis/type III secretory pathway protein FliH
VARVVKAGEGAARPARPATKVLAQADVKKVIDKELYLAKQEAEELLRKGDEERRQILTDGRKQSALAREEAMTRGASTAFAQAAQEALEAFRRRGERYGEAADDIRVLALEIARKILGNEPDLGPNDVERILQKGLYQLRARRRLRVQVCAGRKEELGFERPNLMKAVAAEPDLLVEDADDVRRGYARVVTEVGGALCAEDNALDALARAVNVHEQPRAKNLRPGTGATQVGVGPSDPELDALRRGEVSTGESSETGTGILRPASRRTAILSDLGSLEGDGDLDLPSDLPEAAVLDELSAEGVARDDFEEDDDLDDFGEDADATRALPARGAVASHATPPRAPPLGDGHGGARAANDRVATGRIEALPRRGAPTRVLRLDEKEALLKEARKPAAATRVVGAAGGARPLPDEDELHLFTDERPRRR